MESSRKTTKRTMILRRRHLYLTEVLPTLDNQMPVLEHKADFSWTVQPR
jgi:hypothetical protein